MPPPPATPPDGAEPLPRAQVRTACAVVGCLGLTVVVAVAALVYIVLTVLGDLTPQPTGTEKEKPKKASARPDPVGPTALKTDRAVFPLPATFDAVGPAANGRFLLLRVPFKSEVAVFDPVEAKITRTFPLGAPNALFAGGAGKLHVFRPKAKEFEQFDLLTGERDETAKKPDAMAAVDHLLAGAGVDEPLLVLSAGQPKSDVAVGSPPPAAWKYFGVTEWAIPDASFHARASADGRTIGLVSRADDRAAKILRFAPPGSFAASPVGKAGHPGHLTPSPDGRAVYSARGVFDRDGKYVLRPDGDTFYTFPAAHGSDLYLSIGVDHRGKFEPPLRLHLAGSRIPVATIDRVSLPTGLDARDSSDVPMDQRIHLWPAAGLLAVLPTSNAAIDMYKVDVGALLKASGKDHLVFATAPPTTATRGEKLVYEPKVWSAPDGPVSFEVVGPAGAAMRGPVLLWSVPESTPEREVGVTLRAKHPDGRTAEQSFRVLLVEPAPKS